MPFLHVHIWPLIILPSQLTVRGTASTCVIMVKRTMRPVWVPYPARLR